MISYVLLFYPVMITFMVVSYDAAIHSWDTGERSQESVWRVIMWPFRATIPLVAVLLMIQGVSEVLKCRYQIQFGREFEHRKRSTTGLELLGLFMLLVMLGAIFIGLPISFTLLFLAGVFGYIGMGPRVLSLAYLQTIGIMKQDELVAVPMFILMGFICDQAGLMERLFKAFRDLFAPLKGALYVVVILTATLFGIAAGTVGATVTLLGIMAGPMMIRAGYDVRMSAGSIAAGGTLQIPISPSVMWWRWRRCSISRSSTCTWLVLAGVFCCRRCSSATP